MWNSWFSSKSSRHRRTLSNPPPAPESTQSSPLDASSVSQPTVGPLQTPANLSSSSDVPLDELHARISDQGVYAPTPSLIHSAEKDVGTLRTSDAPASLATYRRDSAQVIQQVFAPEHLEGTPFTPQDTFIAQVFGRSVQSAANPGHATPSPPSNALQPSVSLTTSDPAPTPPSIQISHVQMGPTLTIYDPFSGTKLGEHTPISPSTATPGELSASAPLPTADDRKLWSSLERILELQAEIAAMHADMESVGGKSLGNTTHMGGNVGIGTGEGGNVGPRRRSRRGQTLPIGDEEPEEHDPESGATGGAASEISTDHSDSEDEEDEDDYGVRGYGKKRRDEEFARLAEQFAQRKAAIGGIMNKLDALSTALKTFHTLPPPLFDLAASPSRADTLSSAPSKVPATSSSPPLRVYPGRSSFPLSSVSPLQPGNPVTSSTSLSPPVPLISTLAPPMSSGDPSTTPGLPPMVVPVLPKISLPTTILEAPHVESPADMDRAQSIFQGMP